MENIALLDDIRSAMEQSLVLRSQLKLLVESAQKYEGETKQILIETKDKLKSLEVREKAVQEKENKILSTEALEHRSREIEEQATQIQNLRLACDRECAEKRADLSNELADFASKVKDLEARERALEEDRKTYKATLLRKLGKDPS